MDGRAVLHPVGPYEPRVYWTRRAVLLLAIVLVLVLLVAYGCGGGNGRPTAGQPTTTPSGSPTPNSSPTTLSACTRDRLTVGAGTDATTYPAGVLPHLTATIRTNGSAPCELPVSAISWEIVSGSDTVYTTAGCGAGARASFTLRPGHPIKTGRIWDRHRSVAGCATPGAAAGPGTYQLHVTVDGVRSAVAVFHLTG